MEGQKTIFHANHIIQTVSEYMNMAREKKLGKYKFFPFLHPSLNWLVEQGQITVTFAWVSLHGRTPYALSKREILKF